MTTTKSCVGCPSLLSRADAAKKYGQDVGAPVCSRHGHVIGNANMNDAAIRKVGEAFAKDCADHGAPMPVVSGVEYPVAMVAKPSLAAAKAGMERRAHGAAAASSCAVCPFMVSANVVYDEFGFNANLCTATGRLVYGRRVESTAKACSIGVTGQTATIDAEIELLPIYTGEHARSVAADWASSIIDPQDYPTDLPVSTADASHGIRAWRKIEDPEGYGPSIPLPIFDLESFDADDRRRVPITGSQERPEMFIDHQGLVYDIAQSWMESDKVPEIIGHAGGGKTELLRHIGWLMAAPFDRVNFNKSTEPDQIVGQWTLINGEMVFKEGRLPVRWRKRGVTLLDEPNRAETVIQELLLPMLDNSKQFMLESAAIPFHDPETGEMVLRTPPPITRNAYAFMALAINPSWHPMYHGTQDFDQALVSRVDKMWTEYPPEDVERDILIRHYHAAFEKVPPKKHLDAVVGVGRELRALCDEGTLSFSWGIREQVAVITKMRHYRMPKAYMRAVGDHFEPETRTTILDVVQAHDVTSR